MPYVISDILATLGFFCEIVMMICKQFYCTSIQLLRIEPSVFYIKNDNLLQNIKMAVQSRFFRFKIKFTKPNMWLRLKFPPDDHERLPSGFIVSTIHVPCVIIVLSCIMYVLLYLKSKLLRVDFFKKVCVQIF